MSSAGTTAPASDPSRSAPSASTTGAPGCARTLIAASTATRFRPAAPASCSAATPPTPPNSATCAGSARSIWPSCRWALTTLGSTTTAPRSRPGGWPRTPASNSFYQCTTRPLPSAASRTGNRSSASTPLPAPTPTALPSRPSARNSTLPDARFPDHSQAGGLQTPKSGPLLQYNLHVTGPLSPEYGFRSAPYVPGDCPAEKLLQGGPDGLSHPAGH